MPSKILLYFKRNELLLNSIKIIIENELKYFDNNIQIDIFSSYQKIHFSKEEFTWQYSEEIHPCYVIAQNNIEQIIFCKTGFGLDFPWGVVKNGESDLGMDSQWNAYLYEAFISSSLFNADVPSNFELMGPGERKI